MRPMTNQQLKAHCEDVIANPQDHLDWVVDMARVALASLEAEPVVKVTEWMPLGIDGGVSKFLQPVGNLPDFGALLYTAPPVAELKPIELVKELPDNSKESLDYRIGFAIGCSKYAEGMLKNIRAAGYEVKS